MMNKVEWTDDLIERIKVMIDDKMSTSMIALEIGGGMTKNMIIGKFRRLGIPLANPRFVCKAVQDANPVRAVYVPPPLETGPIRPKIGDRVCISERGIASNIRTSVYVSKSGVIKSFGRGGLPLVVWDGTKTASPIAWAFIQASGSAQAQTPVDIPSAPTVPGSPPAPVLEPPKAVQVIAKKARHAPFTGYGQVDIPEGAAMALFYLPANGCKWPDGDPFSADFRMCGDPRAPDSSYCACHAAMSVGTGTYGERKATSPLNRRLA